MTRAETDLDNAKAIFFSHRKYCESCMKVNIHKTRELVGLCYQGTLAYKALIKTKYVGPEEDREAIQQEG